MYNTLGNNDSVHNKLHSDIVNYSSFNSELNNIKILIKFKLLFKNTIYYIPKNIIHKYLLNNLIL